MAPVKLSRFLRNLTRGMVAETLGGQSDRELVARFLACQEEEVFEAFVRRHGPMVYRVCWRVLQHSQDAEDAFQATFLLLAQKLPTVRNRDSLASWLHGVAHRTALKAKAQAATRHRHEGRASVSRAVPPDDVTWRELRTVLDAELAQLPEKWRLPLILCYLEGRTQEEAAGQLGCSKSTLVRRLDEARAALGRRLNRKGVVWPAALSAVLLSDCVVSAAPPSGLIGSTTEAAACAAAGRTLAGLVSARVAALTEGVLQTMLLSRLGTVTAVLLVVTAVIGVSLGAAAFPQPAAQPTEERTEGKSPPSPADAVPEGLAGKPNVRGDQDGDPLPAGTQARLGTARLRHGSSVFFVAVLSDGKQVLSAGEDGLALLWDMSTGKEVRRFGTPHPMPADWRPGRPPPAALTVALSPDGKVLATSDGDVVRLWNTSTGKETGQVKGLEIAVSALALAPDGKTLAAAGPGGPVVLWDLEKAQEVRRLDSPADRLVNDPNIPVGRSDLSYFMLEKVRRPNGPAGTGQGIWNERAKPHLAFSADGKTLLSANLGLNGRNVLTVVRLWDVATGKELRRVETGDGTFAVSAALSPDGKTVAWADQSATDGGTVHLMEAATGKELHRFPAGGTAYLVDPTYEEGQRRRFPGVGTQFAFAPDGKTLVTRALGAQVVVWDVTTGKELRRVGKPLPPPTWYSGIGYLSLPRLAVSPDGKALAVAGDGNAVTLLDLTTGREVHPRGAHPTVVTAVGFSADGKVLTSLGGDGTVRTWEAATGKETGLARVPEGMLPSALSPDGRTLASSGLDGRVRLTDAATGKGRGTIQTPQRGPLRLAISPDGRALAVGGWASTTVRLYDVATRKETRALTPEGEKDQPAAGIMPIPFRAAPPPVFSADGNRLAAPGRSVLHIWDVGAGKEVRRLPLAEDRAVGMAALSPDGRSVALDMQDGTVAVWEVATGKRLHLFKSGPAVVPARPQGGPPGVAPLPPTDPVMLAFSPDGRVLAHSRDREVAVWDLDLGKKLGRLKGHQGVILGGAFAPDGKALATASADTTVLVWDVAALTRGPQR